MTKPSQFPVSSMKSPLRVFVVMSILGTVSPAAAAKTLIDYFLPMPIHDRLRSDVRVLPPSARATFRTALKTPR